MKLRSKWILNLTNGFLSFVWYANMALFAVAFVVLTMVYVGNDTTDMSIAVKRKGEMPATVLKPLTSQTTAISIAEDQAVIKLKVKTSFVNMVVSYTLLFMFEALVIITIYNLRKIFASIKQQLPFQYDNIRRLKITALCLALFTPLHMVYGFLNYFMLTQFVAGFSSQYMLVWADGFVGVILGAALYIIADIFSYGFELKQENEEFV